MKRRDFLKKAGVAVAASSTLSPHVFAQGQSFRFGMVTSWPASLANLHGGVEDFARYMNEMTGGDVQIDVFPAGAEVGALEVYDVVSAGAFELGHTASYYYMGNHPAHGFFTAMPFGLNAQQHNAWLTTADGQALWDELNARDNLIAFAAGNTGTQMAGWFRREINTIEDLQGLVMRIPGPGGQVMDRAGVTVQLLPGGETYLALERGTIDAVEWVGPHDDEILGLQNAATYYYAPGWQEPGATVSVYCNLDTFNSLPTDIQNMMRAAAARVNVEMLANYDASNGEALDRMVEGGTQLRFLSDEILDRLEQLSWEIYDEEAARSDFYARVLESYMGFRDRVRPFHRVSEYAYLDAVFRRQEQNS